MSRIRHFIAPVAFAWLLLHVAVFAGTAVLMTATGGAPSELVCTCEHGAGHGLCPMHGTPSDVARCRLQSTQNELGVALLSTLGPLTLPTAAADVVAVSSEPLPRGYDTTLPLDCNAPPDAPPPRS